MDEKTNKTPEKGWNGPVRRVGSLTLGVCLIASGVLFLCYFRARRAFYAKRQK